MTSTTPAAPLTFRFADDGRVPNNPTLPFVAWRHALDLGGTDEPAGRIEATFAAAGWGRMWRDGIYSFIHYHSMIHEALGVARGTAQVRFGGDSGEILALAAGDVCVLPAGTGHQCLSASDDFLVVGAYPPTGTYDLCRAGSDEIVRARRTIPQVPLPDLDPVTAGPAPLLDLWRP